MFGHEKFEAYNHAIAFIEIALRITDQLPVGYSKLSDQLKRAAFSIALNIAEGSGKYQRNERNRFYRIARGSAMECAAICDIVIRINKDSEAPAKEGKVILKMIVNILTTVCLNPRKN